MVPMNVTMKEMGEKNHHVHMHNDSKCLIKIIFPQKKEKKMF
jgi:hypothetical protein